MTIPWTWKQGDAGFKNGKLYLGSERELLETPQEETHKVIIIRATDLRCWMLIKHDSQPKAKMYSYRGDLPLGRILRFAKAEKKREKKGRTPYSDFIEVVGEENLKLAIRANAKGRRVLTRILTINGYKELLQRFPLAAKVMSLHNLDKCRRLIKYNDNKLINLLRFLPVTELKGFGISETLKRMRLSKIDPPSKAEIKALKKVHINSCHSIDSILRRFENVTTNRKFHLKTITPELLEYIQDAEALSILIPIDMARLTRDGERVANKQNKKGIVGGQLALARHRLHDILRQREGILQAGYTPVMKTVGTTSEIRALHDDLTTQLYKIHESNVYFPKPWIPGNEYIIPITDSYSLKEEGLKMHHCCGSYKYSVFSGHCYIYHVEEGKHRGTLELHRNNNGTYRIHQFRSVSNKAVDKSLQKRVELWLAEHNKR